MMADSPTRWLRDARLRIARLPSLRLARVPDGPAHPVRDPWPGDPGRGAALLRGELIVAGTAATLRPGKFDVPSAAQEMQAYAHGFAWLRDLRALGTDAARMRARTLVQDWMEGGHAPVAQRPEVAGSRITAWLSQYDFFAGSADDGFRHRLMTRLVLDAKTLAAGLPTEEVDGRALTALKGVIAAAVALPDHVGNLSRPLRLLPQELARQVLPDGTHCERSPARQLTALMDLIEIRALLQVIRVEPPPVLEMAIERMALALRTLRHGDGGLALFNGGKESESTFVDLVLGQAGRPGRAPAELPQGGFQRLQAGRTLLIVDCGAPPAARIDRWAHAGTLAFELSVGRERMVVNLGAVPAGGAGWRDALRATAAHSTLIVADTNSSELREGALGRRPEKVEVSRQEANGAYWLELSHDGYRRGLGAIHRRRLYVAESGEDVRGEDAVEAAHADAGGQPYTVRFHLHPDVSASLQQDGEAVLLRLPSGSGWRLRADGAKISLEESLYLGGVASRRCEQVVLSGYADGPQHVKWAITKVG